ncbi:TGRM1 protein, partial [Rostratula benghalensis]|nr:TGRM1 protein [Rostratula benghalensis]
QPQVSGVQADLGTGRPGYRQTRRKSGSVDSELQLLGLNNSQEDKVCASLSFSSKTQRSFCSQAEHTLSFPGPGASQGAFVLPSHPLSSPRSSPGHGSSPTNSPQRARDNTMSFSSSWPLKSFEGLPKPGSQKPPLGQKSGDSRGRRGGGVTTAYFRFVFSQNRERGGHSLCNLCQCSLPLEAEALSSRGLNTQKCTSFCLKKAFFFFFPPSAMNKPCGFVSGGVQMQNSLRSLRNSAAKKRAKLSGDISDLESPDSAVKLDLSLESPSHAPSPSGGSCSQSRARSQDSPRRRITHLSTAWQQIPGCRSVFSKRQGPHRGRRELQHRYSPASVSLDLASPACLFLSRELVVLCLSGVFGSPPSAQTPSQAVSRVLNGDDQGGQEKPEPWSVPQSSVSHFHGESEKQVKVTMARSAQEKVRRKKREEKEHGQKEHQEARDLEEKEEYPWERLKLNEAEKMATENDLSLGARGRCKDRTPSVTHSPEIMDPSELQPFSKPEAALTEALALLADDDWWKKIEGLNSVRCLSAYHGAVLTAKLHETSLAVAQEVKNLRSGVSRAAVVCLGDLFTHLKKSMDQELDNTVKVLLHKAGESNTFIREEVDKALKAMVNNVTPARALCSLINGGQSVFYILGHYQPGSLKPLGSPTCHSSSDTGNVWLRCVCPGLSPCRYYGRKMLFTMMNHPDFEKTLEKYVPTKDLPYIKESVCSLQDKGLGEMPLDTPSARGRRSHTGSVGHSRSSSTSREALTVTDSREAAEAREVTRKPAPRNSLENEEYVKDIISLLNAKDFRDRITGIKQLLSDTESNQGFVVANIVKIFDAFKSRLHDSNSKVNQVALETMHKMIPLLKDNLSPVINMLIPATVDNNLNSKNPGIYAAATNVIQALCQHLGLVTELYPRKPYAVEQKVLLVLWHLLGNASSSGSLPGAGGNMRAATAKLSRALFAQMGPGLLAQAASQPPHIRKSLEEFLE